MVTMDTFYGLFLHSLNKRGDVVLVIKGNWRIINAKYPLWSEFLNCISIQSHKDLDFMILNLFVTTFKTRNHSWNTDLQQEGML